VDSTNRVLLERPCPPRPHLLLARRQTQGRGRRGRSWLADPDGSLCLSLAWCSRRPLRQCAALGLVAAVACADALRGLGAAVAVKWPNDLVHAGAKLGGVLVEARAA